MFRGGSVFSKGSNSEVFKIQIPKISEYIKQFAAASNVAPAAVLTYFLETW